MTPESPVLAELRTLLDAVCEECATPEQLRRLEELVLAHPEAEAHYVRFLTFYSDLIGHFAALPEPPVHIAAGLPAVPVELEPERRASPPLSEPSSLHRKPDSREKPMRTPRSRRAMIAWLVVLGVAGFAGYEYYGWHTRERPVEIAERALGARRAELAQSQQEQNREKAELAKTVEAATVAEREEFALYRSAQEAARKAVEAKDFVVRLTGPAHIQPGAPNKWQVETLRHGAVVRPKKMDVIVKDEKDAELFRQTHDKPVGVATLELTPAFWEKVRPGTELFLEVVAFTDDDRKGSLSEKLPLARPVYVTHLVTDKPLYRPGETIRFRSLTLDRATLRPPAHDTHLVFKLRDPSDTAVLLDDGNGRLVGGDLQPVLGPDKKPLRGIGVGEYALPADAPGGEYKLDLFEIDRESAREVRLETRKFLVNRYVPDTFEKKLEFDGKSYGAGEYVQARVEVSRTAGGPMTAAKADVVATVDGKTIHEKRDSGFTAITDPSGTKTILDVRFRLPSDIYETGKTGAPPSATLSVTIRDGSDAEAIVRPIPLVTKMLNVEFFPEGGEMIAGVPGRVYVMVRTPNGKPADLRGTITNGTETVTEFTTLTDAENPGVNRGHGVFTITPKAGSKYFLKLSSPVGVTEPTKDGFPLPAAKADGVALTALDAVTARGGAIGVRLRSPVGPKVLHVGAYARGQLIAHQKVTLEADRPMDVSLKSDESAGGVTRVTVFEEPAKGEAAGRALLIPRAERLVFRGTGEFLNLSVTPDNSRYTPAGKVRLDLAATTETGAPAPAVLLVGVVNRSVITMADNKTDRLMPAHFLLSGDVKHPAELEHADFLLTDHPKAAQALDLLLGTQGWRRFAEQDVAPANPADRPEIDRMLVAHGQRTSAPVEMFKLEERRVAAEFAPRLEQAHLRVAEAQAAANTAQSPLTAKITAAAGAVAVAEVQLAAARSELAQFEARVERMVPSLQRVLVLALVAIFFFVIIMATVAGGAKAPAKRSKPLVVGTAAVGVFALLLVALVNTSHSPKEEATFEFVGASIRPGSERDAAALPSPRMAVEASAGAGARLGGKAPQMMGMRPGSGGPPPGMAMPGAGGDGDIRPAPRSDQLMGMMMGAPKPKLSVRTIGLEASKRVGIPGGLVVREAGQRETRLRDGRRSAERIADFDKALSKNPDLVEPTDPVAGSLRVSSFVVREYAHQRDPSLGDVRSDFTETVYWHPVLVLPDTGKASVEFQLSDDIARYQVLVAGHTTDGRIGAVTKTIEARKPFSVDPKLPLEISHTDAVDVAVRVTNDSDVRRNVSFTTKATGFKAAGATDGILDLAPNAKGRKILRFTPDKLSGDATVQMEATSIPVADKDMIARNLRIVPDGFPGVGSYSDTLAGRAKGSITLPKDVVPGTLKVRLEVYPTSLADLVSGLEGMLREPCGCFEQTSSSNYPNTLILDFLNQSNQANPQVAARAKEMLARGYARLTGFECPDTKLGGKRGFEWFGAADRPHEALTAYGLLQFKDMARVYSVDPALIKRTQDYLLSRRDGKGGFELRADGHSFGAAPKHIVWAYITWALVESDPTDAERLDLKTEIATLKALALADDSAAAKDPYFVALVANVLLHRADRETAYRLLDRIQEKHFKDGAVTGATTSVVRSAGRDLDIETTALAVMGWARANDPKYHTTVRDAVKWISKQRGGYGGFGSTQSTILALKAMVLAAGKFARPAERGEILVTSGGRPVAVRPFNENDVEVIGVDIPDPETVFKPGERTEVEITTAAKQSYPFALSYTYTTLTPLSAEQCAVRVSTKLAKNEAAEGETVPLAVTLENKQKKGHGMATAIIGLPAGMRVPTDMKQLTDLREKEKIDFFETRGRELILYWRELGPEQKIDLQIELVCDVPGTYRGPASRAYLYYAADHKHWVEPLSIKINPAAGE